MGVRCNSPNSREHKDNLMLGFLEPVHDLAENVRTIHERLTVGVFRGIY